MTKNPTCCSCCVNSDWVKERNTYMGQFSVGKINGLTDIEKGILIKLANAWTEYATIESKDSRKHEFNDAIHRCQQLIALRVASRLEPEIWAS